MWSRREILEYANRADEDEDLACDLQFVPGMGAPATLRARRGRGGEGPRPPALPCDAADVQALIALGYLSQRRHWVRITLAGKAQLGRA